ncbi:MAG: aldehyde dehydrogenase family protein [Nitrosomonadaceae bacterium]|nr:aldehyde dehydrogenase family protein [Nitrosomonadaceae bacterium]
MAAMFKVRNPRNGEYDYEFARSSPADIALQSAKLRAQSRVWAEMSPKARADLLLRWAEALKAERQNLIDALVVDTGRRRESELEVDSAIGNIMRWAARAPALLEEPATRESVVKPMTLTAASVPVGLVAVISPWNFPLLLALIDTVPALAAGCPVMVKPSEVTPRFVEPLRRAINAVPELSNVLHVVQGGPDTGAAMIDNADAVCFTGSVATGRMIAKHCAERLIACFLELGGKDAAIVLEGVDVSRAARSIAWGGNANAGQSCLSVERVFVERLIYAAFTAALAAECNALKLAYPRVDDGVIGPLTAERQAVTIRSQLDDAYARGAKALAGSNVEELGGGLWCKPVVLVDVTPDMKIMTEETFGPVLPVMPFDTIDEAIALANGTEFGLSGAVFGPRERAIEVAKQMHGGAISINDAALTAIVHDGEKQAFKNSGLGPSRMGDTSITRFRRKRVFIENATLQHDPWWFPAQG